MLRTRHVIGALRAAALWLLVMAVFFGPAGLGGSAAFASAAKACGVSCPCDAVDAGERGSAGEEHGDADLCANDVDGDKHRGGDLRQDECPDDCPNCACSLGVAMAVLPLSGTSNRATCTSARLLALIDAPASGAGSSVFRPPRSLI